MNIYQMNELHVLTESLRDWSNKYPRPVQLKTEVSWNRLCASLDTLEDADSAVEFYLNLKELNGWEGGYLYIYGLFQAIFLQQDALNNIHLSIFNEKIDWRSSFPEIHEIREIRNDLTGHPTSRYDRSFHLISRPTITKDSFEVMDYIVGEGVKFRKVQLDSYLHTQRHAVLEILKKVISRLNLD